ncbi:MAG: hypothetical protein AAF596_01265, partial [Planctomycetota bacterium]
KSVPIATIRVGDDDRLRLRPTIDGEWYGYGIIYRAAAWIYWDQATKELYVSPAKSESHRDQFLRIVRVV